MTINVFKYLYWKAKCGCRKQTLTDTKLAIKTRMHSSRMRTARSSSHLGGVSTRHPPGTRPPCNQTAPPEQAPQDQEPLGPGTPPRIRHPPGTRPPGAGPPGTRHPPWTEWQTGVKILPCPKLRLRAVIRIYYYLSCISKTKSTPATDYHYTTELKEVD